VLAAAVAATLLSGSTDEDASGFPACANDNTSTIPAVRMANSPEKFKVGMD